MSADLFEKLSQLNLPVQDYAIFGSGPLLAKGIISESGDLDVLCRGEAWRLVCQRGEVKHLDEYDVEIVSLFDGLLTFGPVWGIGDFDANELIERAEVIDGLPFVLLEYVIAYKRIRNSGKDLSHLESMRAAGYL